MVMEWNEYVKLFDEILEGKITGAPYDQEDFLKYVSLNKMRQNRWLKHGKLNHELTEKLQRLNAAQEWILITEPWCGDASQIAPFVQKLAECSDNICLTIQLRDSEGSLINDYLTNGAMAIPKLIVRNENGNDLFNWGPRPADAQQIHLLNKENTEKTAEEKKTELQLWYNKDKGAMLQEELLEAFNAFL